jgi:hypothetical protein
VDLPKINPVESIEARALEKGQCVPMVDYGGILGRMRSRCNDVENGGLAGKHICAKSRIK